MLAADAVIWIGLLLLVGFVGFFVVVIVMGVRLIGYVFRALFGTSSTDDKRELPHAARNGRRCPRPACQHVNPSRAQFCARCGQPLGAFCDVDAYG